MNFYQEDPNLAFVLDKYLDQSLLEWGKQQLDDFGKLCGTEIDERAAHTDREGKPKLMKYDRMGNEVSKIWLNEGYKKTVRQVYECGIVGYVHKNIPELGRKGDYVYAFAQGYLLSQAEPGFHCPVTLTTATAYLLDKYGDEKLKRKYLPHIIATGDTELYEGATFLTERQGGSDVGSNETTAIFDGDCYRLSGEKYFASNAGACGVAMVLARRENAPSGTKGLSLFLVPWQRENGKLDGIQIRRLKDKLGVKAVPSAEVVFDRAKGYLVGDPTKGFYYMMEALNLSRICNAVASVGVMQRALLEAKNYAAERFTFGHYLTDFPMIRETLATMTAKQEVTLSAIFALTTLFHQVSWHENKTTDTDRVMNRLLIALLKMETAEEAIRFSHEAIEMHGGNGFIEDFVTPRLLRDAQVLTVWEGPSNILGLEVLRLMRKFNAHELFLTEMKAKIAALPTLLQDLAAPIFYGITKLSDLCTYVMQADHDAQTYHCKRVARKMAKIYESVIALEDAHIGDERKTLIAKVFLESVWGNAYDIDRDMISIKHFHDIVYLKTKSISETS